MNPYRTGVWSLALSSGLALTLALAAAGGCSKKPDAPAAATAVAARAVVPVALAVADVRTVQRQIEVVGTLWGDEDTLIATKVAGKVVGLTKDVGDTAVANEPLAQIEKTDYELAVMQKRLAVSESLAKVGLKVLPPEGFDAAGVPTVQRALLQSENARARFNRGKMLYEQQPPRISAQEFDDLKTGLEVAERNGDVETLTAKAVIAEARARQGDLEVALQRLSDTTVRSPDDKHPDGTPRRYTVAGRMGSVGEYMKEGSTVFRLVDDDRVKLRAPVPERYAAEVRVGQKVRLRVESSPEEFWGTVARINVQVDPANRTFALEAAVPNPRRLLNPGAFAHAWVQTRTDDKVVFVPQEAVVSFAGVSKVFVVKDGQAQEVRVEVGEHQAGSIEITRGLTGAEHVVVAGAGKLATGVAVEAK